MECLNSQQDRRRIERQAFSGALLGIIATNALELGVDIGALDAVIMLGFPFSVANLVGLAIACLEIGDHLSIAPASWAGGPPLQRCPRGTGSR